MSAPFVTYTFVNGAGNYIDADEVNTNYTDILGAISSGSSADLAAASLVITSSITAAALTVTNLYVGGSTFNSAVISAASASINSQIAAYDYTDIVSAEVSYVSGIFTAIVSGISDGAGNNRTFTANYIRQKNLVHVFIPAHNGQTDSSLLWYTITGFPADITPANSMTIDLPMGALENGAHYYSNTVGKFGNENAAASGLSCLDVLNTDGWWGGATATKGYDRAVVLVYKL